MQGIQAFECLRELYCAFNFLEDIWDISFLENLYVLDLEANEVKDLKELYYLNRLRKLTDLNLQNNPNLGEYRDLCLK